MHMLVIFSPFMSDEVSTNQTHPNFHNGEYGASDSIQISMQMNSAVLRNINIFNTQAPSIWVH